MEKEKKRLLPKLRKHSARVGKKMRVWLWVRCSGLRSMCAVLRWLLFAMEVVVGPRNAGQIEDRKRVHIICNFAQILKTTCNPGYLKATAP